MSTKKSATTADKGEIAVVKRQATAAEQAVTALKIKKPEDMVGATDLLSKIKQAIKFVSEKKDSYTRPAYESYKRIMDQAKLDYDPVINRLKQLETEVKGKMLSYQREVDEVRRKEEEKLAKKVESGYMKEETALNKLSEVPTAVKKVETEKGKIVTRKVKKFEVEDKSKLPIECLEPNLTFIRTQMHAGKQYPGVRYWEDEEIAGTHY